MEGYIGFENYKDNKLRLEVGRVYTRRPVIGGKLSFFDNPLDVLRYYPPCDSGYSRVESPDNKTDKQGHHVNTSELRVIEDVGLGDIAECRSKKVIDVKSTQVDGDRIKANTFYRLKNGEFVECKGM